MATAIVTGATGTATGPSNRQKLEIGQKRRSRRTDLNIPIVKRKKRS